MSFGLLGGIIGSSIGSSIAAGTAYSSFATHLGWTIGSMLFTYLFQKGTDLYQEGPRLSDSKYTFSIYGVGIPKIFGTYRTAGNVIWMTPIRETRHEDRQESGKGSSGDSSTSVWYTYDATWAVGISEGLIGGVSKIWADSVLIYENGKTGQIDLSNITIYKGSKTQKPDWRMESDKGAGNVPGYRNVAYIIFDSVQLEKFGNKIPNITVEITNNFTSAIDTGIKAHWSWTDASIPIGQLDNGTDVIVGRIGDNNLNTLDLHITEIFGDSYNSKRIYAIDSVACDAGKTYSYPIHDLLNGNITGKSINFVSYYNNKLYLANGGGNRNHTPCPYSPEPIIEKVAAYTNNKHYFHIGDHGVAVVYEKIDEFWDSNLNPVFLYLNGLTYHITDGVFQEKTVFCPSKTVAYISLRSTTTTNTYKIFKVENGAVSQVFGTDVVSTYTNLRSVKVFSYLNNNLMILEVNNNNSYEATIKYVENDTFSTITSRQFGPFDVGTLPAYKFNSFVSENSVVTIAIPRSTNVASSTYGSQTPTDFYTILPYVADVDGVPVSDIVEYILNSCGIYSDYSLTAGENINIRGYSITKAMSGRNAMQPILDAKNLALAEYNGELTLINLIKSPVASINYYDLEDNYEFKIIQETDLFRKITVKYANPDADYQASSQHAARINTNSVQENTFELPMVLTNSEAKQLAEVLLNLNWVNRKNFRFTTSRQLLDKQPTDIIQFTDDFGNTYLLKIDKIGLIDENKIEVSASLYESELYISNAIGSSAGSRARLLRPIGNTELAVLNCPTLDNSLLQKECVYLAVGGYSTSWAGAKVYARDTYNGESTAAAILTNGTAIGKTYSNSILGGTKSQHFYTKDKTNTIDIIINTRYPFSSLSVTDENLLKGANYMLIGNEVIQFQTVQVDPDAVGYSNLFRISNLLRGRLGTESFIESHVANEDVVLLNSALNYYTTTFNTSKYYSAVSLGNSTSNESTQELLLYDGTNRKTYAPAYFRAQRETNDDITFKWKRRSRYFRGNLTRLPLVETTESYTLKVYDGSTYINEYNIVGATTFNYNTTLQANDFPTVQPAQISFVIYQDTSIGNLVGYPSDIISIEGI